MAIKKYDLCSYLWAFCDELRGGMDTSYDYVVANYVCLTRPLAEARPAMFGHAEFTASNAQASARFQRWRQATTPQLTGFAKDKGWTCDLIPKSLTPTAAALIAEGHFTGRRPSVSTWRVGPA